MVSETQILIIARRPDWPSAAAATAPRVPGFTAFFAMLAASTVAIPILAYVAAGDRRFAERLKDWMEKNHAGMVAAILMRDRFTAALQQVHAM